MPNAGINPGGLVSVWFFAFLSLGIAALSATGGCPFDFPMCQMHDARAGGHDVRAM